MVAVDVITEPSQYPPILDGQLWDPSEPDFQPTNYTPAAGVSTSWVFLCWPSIDSVFWTVDEAFILSSRIDIPCLLLVYGVTYLPALLELFKVLTTSFFEDPIIWWPWEPPLADNKRRIYWNCGCGAELFDDVPLQDDPNTGQTQSTRQASVSETLVNFGTAVRRVYYRLNGWIIRSRNNKPALSGSKSGPNTQQGASTELQHLLVCINTKRHRARLVQIPVFTHSRDGIIFQTFRSHYFRVRGWRSMLTLRTVESLRFVKFELYLKDLVGIKYEEIPPDDVKEYDYSPRPCPQKSLPPYGPVSKGSLLHNFEEPHIFTNYNWILPRIPKKLDPPLHSKPEYVDGWGLHVVEGLCVIRMIIAGGFVVVLSLVLYGVLLVVWQSRQDAAATAAFYAAVLTLLLMVVQLLQGVM
ncbi:hypothetical protein K440DRAFT_36683 [Wilcoxina mikolae CBS 423.85]|nr:hypothetical protein K440DRAFT_36683 [Wilcoxina mikolae CBS 423.85]